MNLKKLQNLPNTPLGKVLNAVRLFRGYSPVPPLFIQLLLTYRCNLNCEFCYQGKAKRAIIPDMTLKEAGIIEENIRGSFRFRPRVHFFGGEPLVNEDFAAILTLFSEKGYRTSLTTNGVEIDNHVEALTAIRGLSEINLSLNTADVEKTLSTLDLFRKYQNRSTIHINIACPINAVHQARLVDIVNKFDKSHAGCITFQHTRFTGMPKETMDCDIIRSQVEEIKKSSYEIPVLFFPDIKPEDLRSYYGDPAYPYHNKKCVYPWFVLFIQPNGNVIPCDEMDIRMGNAKEESLKKIWNGEKYVEFRRGIIRCGLSYATCQRCCQRQYY